MNTSPNFDKKPSSDLEYHLEELKTMIFQSWNGLSTEQRASVNERVAEYEKAISLLKNNNM